MASSIRYTFGDGREQTLTVTGTDPGATVEAYLSGTGAIEDVDVQVGSHPRRWTNPVKVLLYLLEARNQGQQSVTAEDVLRVVWKGAQGANRNYVEQAVSKLNREEKARISAGPRYRIQAEVKRELVTDSAPSQTTAPPSARAPAPDPLHDLAECLRTVRTEPHPSSLKGALIAYLDWCVFPQMRQAYRVYLACRDVREGEVTFLRVHACSRWDPVANREERENLRRPTSSSNAERVYSTGREYYIRDTENLPDGVQNHYRRGERSIWSWPVLAFGHPVLVVAMAGDEPYGVTADGPLLRKAAFELGLLVETWMLHAEPRFSTDPAELQARIDRFRTDIAPKLA